MKVFIVEAYTDDPWEHGTRTEILDVFASREDAAKCMETEFDKVVNEIVNENRYDWNDCEVTKSSNGCEFYCDSSQYSFEISILTYEVK